MATQTAKTPAVRKPRAKAKAERVSDTPNKGGRPKKLHADEATLKTLRGLGQIQATVREGAAFFGVCLVTFEKFLDEPGVREAFNEGKGHGMISLRRTQFRIAEKNAAMAIFLGKNYLGQSDKMQTEVSGPEGQPIQTEQVVYAHFTDIADRLDALAIGYAGDSRSSNPVAGTVSPEPENPGG